MPVASSPLIQVVPGLMIWTLVCFAVVFFVLRKFAFGPIRKVIDEQPPVPIEALLYRGHSAIQRCREIRDEARRQGGALGDDAKAELFDLLDLALTG